MPFIKCLASDLLIILKSMLQPFLRDYSTDFKQVIQYILYIQYKQTTKQVIELNKMIYLDPKYTFTNKTGKHLKFNYFYIRRRT